MSQQGHDKLYRSLSRGKKQRDAAIHRGWWVGPKRARRLKRQERRKKRQEADNHSNHRPADAQRLYNTNSFVNVHKLK